MNSAVVDQNTQIVVNIVVADPTIDPPPVGCILVGLAVDEPCDIGWVYNSGSNTFSDPNPPSLEGVIS